MSSAGDVNGDGFGDVIVGANEFSSGEGTEGAAFIFHGSSQGIMINNPKVLQSNQQNAMMGHSVSGAGDVNGDGYGDVIIGVPAYDKNELDEGIVKIYYGTNSGITEVSPAPTLLEQNSANAGFGFSVKSAGDVNGDGYSDVIIGAGDFYGANAATIKGEAFVYHGSPTGIKTSPSINVEGSKNGVNLGFAVSGAGDVNGDGYSDVLIGTPHADNGVSLDVGSASVYYGNNGKGLRNNVRLLNSDLTSPISYSQFSQPNFVAGLFVKSFIGKNKGKLVWETMGPGIPFSKPGPSITTSTQSTGAGAFGSLSGISTMIGGVLPKSGISTKVRVRVRYSPVLAITGQMYGPWRYVQSQLSGYNNAPVPQEAMAETIKRKAFTGLEEGQNMVTLYPNPVADRLFIKSESTENIRSLRLLTTGGKLVYQTQMPTNEVDVKNLDAGMYILLVTQQDGSQTSHKVIVKK